MKNPRLFTDDFDVSNPGLCALSVNCKSTELTLLQVHHKHLCEGDNTGIHVKVSVGQLDTASCSECNQFFKMLIK